MVAFSNNTAKVMAIYRPYGDWSNIQTLTIGNAVIPTNTPTTLSPSIAPSPSASATPSTPATTAQPTQNLTSVQPDTQTDVLFGIDWKETAIIVLIVMVAVLAVGMAMMWRRIPSKISS